MVSTILWYQLAQRPAGPRGDTSAEGECECLHAGIKKLDLKLSVDDRLQLSRQQIQPLLAYGSLRNQLMHV
jgi:hypothetical protein